MKLRQKPLQKINRYFPIFNLENYTGNINSSQNTELKLCYDNKTGKFITLTQISIDSNKETYPPRMFLNWPKYPTGVSSINCPVLEEIKKNNTNSTNGTNGSAILYWSKYLDLILEE